MDLSEKIKELFSRFSRIDMYWYMITFLVILILYSASKFGFAQTLAQIIIALVAGSILDLGLKYWKHKKFSIPRSGIITSLLIGSVLGTSQMWYVPVVGVVIAILSKYILKFDGKHIFNPASLGIVIACIIFGTSTGWWLAISLYLVALLGIILMIKMKSYYQVIPFFLTYLVINYLTNSSFFTTVVQGGLDATLIFFMFFMFIEPKTSPYNKKGRILYGVLIPILIYIVTKYAINYIPQADPFLLALLLGNITVPFMRRFVK